MVAAQGPACPWAPPSQIMRRLFEEDSGQDSFEYMLLIGGVAVGIVGALIVGFGVFIPKFLELLCTTVDPLGSGSCFT